MAKLLELLTSHKVRSSLMQSGILILDKPAGITSARAVNIVKHLLPRGTKIGHAGTLDRFATGVLLLLIGRATKSCEWLMGQPKQYEATIKLGATTSTLDPESDEIAPHPLTSISREAIESALRRQVGMIEQLPPDFSALKIGGRRASDRVRAGQSIELRPRPVRIDSIDLLECELPFVRVRIDCGRGTYVRSIARDLGSALGVGGYLTQLRRTRIGDFRISQSLELNDELALDRIVAALQPSAAG